MPSCKRDYETEAVRPPCAAPPTDKEVIRTTTVSDQDGDRIVVRDLANGDSMLHMRDSNGNWKLGPVMYIDKATRHRLILTLKGTP